MMRTVLSLTLLSLLSCSHKRETEVVPIRTLASVQENSGNATAENATGCALRLKEVNGIVYSVRVMNALDFLRQKGDVPAQEDRAWLAEETVLMLEVGLKDLHKDVWQSPLLHLSEEDALSYLVGGIASDVWIEQDGRELIPTGSSFEGESGALNTIRVQLYFGKLDCTKPMKIKIYDRLFGAGLLKFNINDKP